MPSCAYFRVSNCIALFLHGYGVAVNTRKTAFFSLLQHPFCRKGQSANVKEKGAKNHSFLSALTEK
jgi:hypothetical protein